jgi:hypothetical protein
MTYTHKAVCPHLVSVIHNHSFNCLFVNEPKIARTVYFLIQCKDINFIFKNQINTGLFCKYFNIII